MFPYQPQKSLKEQIEDVKQLAKYLEELEKGKPPKKWWTREFSLWETAFIITIFTSIASLPFTLWILTTVAQIKHIVEGL